MNAIVIEHVPVTDLPAAWRDRLPTTAGGTVTIRIEHEAQPTEHAAGFVTDDPALGIWRDRSDMADVSAYLDNLRRPCHGRDESPGQLN